MAVPSSGQLRLRADIALEVDGSATGTNVSLGTLSNTAGLTEPDAMSEFYGYSALEDAIQVLPDELTPFYNLFTISFSSIDSSGGNSSSDPVTASTGSVSNQTRGVDYEVQRSINGFVVNLSRSGTSNNEFKIYLTGSLIHTMSGTSQTYTSTQSLIRGHLITFTFTEDDGSTRSGSLSMYAT